MIIIQMDIQTRVLKHLVSVLSLSWTDWSLLYISIWMLLKMMWQGILGNEERLFSYPKCTKVLNKFQFQYNKNVILLLDIFNLLKYVYLCVVNVKIINKTIRNFNVFCQLGHITSYSGEIFPFSFSVKRDINTVTTNYN